MRFLKTLSFLILFSTLTFAQAAAPKAASPSASDSTVADELKKMQDALAAQQKQIMLQQQEIEALRGQLATNSEVHVVDASMPSLEPPDANAVAVAPASQPPAPHNPNNSPLPSPIS